MTWVSVCSTKRIMDVIVLFDLPGQFLSSEQSQVARQIQCWLAANIALSVRYICLVDSHDNGSAAYVAASWSATLAHAC